VAISIGTFATIANVQFNPTTSDYPNQRSRIDQIVVTFSEDLSVHSSGAFSLVRNGTDDAPFNLAWNSSFSRATLSFGGVSIADGNYQLSIDGDLLAGANRVPVDADGDNVPGGVLTTDFFRLYGDGDGDGDVDFTDLAGFRAALGNPTFNPIFDYDADGDADFTDLAQFRMRLGKDNVIPAVTARSPANGATGVSPNSVVTVTFSEGVQANTISFTLMDVNNTPVAGSVSYDQSTFTATFTPTNTLRFNTGHTASVAGAMDQSGNTMASTSWSFTTGILTHNIFPNSATPAIPSTEDTNAIEVGVKFRSDVAGNITGLRFFKGTANTGTHVGHLWTASGTLLATVTFVGESASGWQQAIFSQPVPIDANTIYVASYFAPTGRYAATNGFFASSGFDNGLLDAPSDAAAGGNGLFRYTSGGAFPDGSFQATNYWVDVVFVV
jgi:hypothetical protein